MGGGLRWFCGDAQSVRHPWARGSHALCAGEDALWLFGGNACTSESEDFGDFWRYQLRGGANEAHGYWVQLEIGDDSKAPSSASAQPCVRDGRNGHGAAYDPVGKLVCLFGGCAEAGTYFSDLYLWDVSGEGEALRVAVAHSGAPSPRAHHSCTYHDGRVYIFGGCDSEHEYNDLYALDLRTLSWQRGTARVPASLTPRFCHSAVERGGRLYVFGGCGEANLNDLHSYDLVGDDGWQLVTSEGNAAPSPRYSMSISADPDHDLVFYVFAGDNDEEKLSDLHACVVNDTGRTCQWVALGRTDIEVSEHRTVCTDGKLFLCGGQVTAKPQVRQHWSAGSQSGSDGNADLEGQESDDESASGAPSGISESGREDSGSESTTSQDIARMYYIPLRYIRSAARKKGADVGSQVKSSSPDPDAALFSELKKRLGHYSADEDPLSGCVPSAATPCPSGSDRVHLHTAHSSLRTQHSDEAERDRLNASVSALPIRSEPSSSSAACVGITSSTITKSPPASARTLGVRVADPSVESSRASSPAVTGAARQTAVCVPSTPDNTLVHTPHNPASSQLGKRTVSSVSAFDAPQDVAPAPHLQSTSSRGSPHEDDPSRQRLKKLSFSQHAQYVHIDAREPAPSDCANSSNIGFVGISSGSNCSAGARTSGTQSYHSDPAPHQHAHAFTGAPEAARDVPLGAQGIAHPYADSHFPSPPHPSAVPYPPSVASHGVPMASPSPGVSNVRMDHLHDELQRQTRTLGQQMQDCTDYVTADCAAVRKQIRSLKDVVHTDMSALSSRIAHLENTVAHCMVPALNQLNELKRVTDTLSVQLHQVTTLLLQQKQERHPS